MNHVSAHQLCLGQLPPSKRVSGDPTRSSLLLLLLLRRCQCGWHSCQSFLEPCEGAVPLCPGVTGPCCVTGMCLGVELFECFSEECIFFRLKVQGLMDSRKFSTISLLWLCLPSVLHRSSHVLGCSFHLVSPDLPFPVPFSLHSRPEWVSLMHFRSIALLIAQSVEVFISVFHTLEFYWSS